MVPSALAAGLVEQFPGCLFLFACAIPWIFLFTSRLVPDSALQKAALQKQSAVVQGKGGSWVKTGPGAPLAWTATASLLLPPEPEQVGLTWPSFSCAKMKCLRSGIRLGLAGFPYLGAGWERCYEARGSRSMRTPVMILARKPYIHSHLLEMFLRVQYVFLHHMCVPPRGLLEWQKAFCFLCD